MKQILNKKIDLNENYRESINKFRHELKRSIPVCMPTNGGCIGRLDRALSFITIKRDNYFKFLCEYDHNTEEFYGFTFNLTNNELINRTFTVHELYGDKKYGAKFMLTRKSIKNIVKGFLLGIEHV